MEAVSHICNPRLVGELSVGKNFTDYSIFNRIRDVGPTFDETMFLCRWRDRQPFCPFFKPILTEEGMCYTFNALNSEEIYREG